MAFQLPSPNLDIQFPLITLHSGSRLLAVAAATDVIVTWWGKHARWFAAEGQRALIGLGAGDSYIPAGRIRIPFLIGHTCRSIWAPAALTASTTLSG